MPFTTSTLVARTLTPAVDRCRDGSGMRPQPERVVLDVADGVTPSGKPPVRIFLGTEPAQHRAERVFVWSIERVRDPSRVYEIYLMKELAGFNRRRWTTGFTNYRFAIPHFAGGAGRAIWNDVDQAWLADPAELFDTDMGDHGFLAIAPGGRTDTAVMLIDCARMASIWTLDGARHAHKNTLIAKALAVPGLRGDLASQWHARDEEYVPGRSRLMHWTILHTQPWHPLPQLFVYQRNPVGEVWHELKRSADHAGYRVFTRDRPSAQYTRLLERLGTSAPEKPARRALSRDLLDLAAHAEAKTILDYGFAAQAGESMTTEETDGRDAGLEVMRYDPAMPDVPQRPARQFDGVVCTDSLDFIPDEDVPWVVEELFAFAGRFVYATVSDRALTQTLNDGSRLKSRPRARSWWQEHFAAAAAHHPEVHWKLVQCARRGAGAKPVYVREAGRRLAGRPAVWVLGDGRPGHGAQSIALAEALGWPYQVKNLQRNGRLAPPWPDLVIDEDNYADEHAAATARQIGRRSLGRTRLVQVGAGRDPDGGGLDAVITPAYYRLPPDGRRIETVTRLTRVNAQRLAECARARPEFFGNAARPHILLLAGDATQAQPIDAKTARCMGARVRTFAERAGGSVFAFTGSRMGASANGALVAGLGQSSHLHWWRPGSHDEDLYFAYLAAADAIVVAGTSESMLADATASGKPVYIYPLPERRPGLAERLEAAVATRAETRPLNRRGTVRPQQGSEYLCARLIQRGIVRPPHDLNGLHQDLIRRSLAHPFGLPLVTPTNTPVLDETTVVAHKLRALLGANQ